MSLAALRLRGRGPEGVFHSQEAAAPEQGPHLAGRGAFVCTIRVKGQFIPFRIDSRLGEACQE